MTQTDLAPSIVPANGAGSPEHQQQLKFGLVTQVLSGDLVVIQPLTPSGLSPEERTLAFSNITAPKLERRPNPNSIVPESKDEPFAWEAREFVRSRVIGQTIAYTVEHTVSNATNRDYGAILLGKSRDSENLTHHLVLEGLAEVRRVGTRPSAAVSQLIALEDQAKAANKGKWNTSKCMEHIRDVKWNVEPLRQFVEPRKGRKFKAIVENVRDGCTLRLLLLPDFFYITLSLTGVRTPVFQYDAYAGTQSPEPLAEEAKSFVEKRLLHREVQVLIEGLSGNMVMGSLYHPAKGNIAPYLLEEGFARVVDWSIASVSDNKEVYFQAEHKAKTQQKGIWKDYSNVGGFPIMRTENKEFTAVVAEINTADTITIIKDDKEMKIKFSSLRGPRLEDNRDRGKNFRPLYQIPCMYEAREFLRKKLIGERVVVSVDYVQPANEQFPEATCCTVTVHGNNVAELLVSKGLATVVKHRRDDDQRSRAYEDLLNAENEAMNQKLGLHNPNKSIVRVSDICGEIKLARNFFTGLTKGNVNAVVEHVAAASRFRLYVPSGTCVLSFLLAGIDCPKPERMINNQLLPAEPMGDEARKQTRWRLLQRDVTIKIENMDRVGNFIGWLFTKDNANYNLKLVKEGFATVSMNMSERHEYYSEMTKAENEAKAANLNLWSIQGFEKAAAPVEEVTEVLDMDVGSERRINYIKVICTEVADNLKFYVQHNQDGPQVELLMQKLQEKVGAMIPGSMTAIKPRDVVAAKFSLDQQWYRAKIEKKASANEYLLHYVDYGNRETVPIADICQLPSEFSLSAFPPFCHEYALAFVKLPTRDDLRQDANGYFAQEILNKSFDMNIEYKIGGSSSAVSLHAADEVDVGLSLVKAGKLLTSTRKEPKFRAIMDKYHAAEIQAKTNRLNIWCYGDITEDETIDR